MHFLYLNALCTYKSQVDESLVHCHGGCQFEPRHRTVSFYILFIFLFIDTIV